MSRSTAQGYGAARFKNRRSLLWLALLAMGLVLLLAACGDDDDEAGADPESADVDSADGEEADPDGEDSEDAPAADVELDDMVAVVPYSPGGGYDSYMRLFVPWLEEELGVNITVENQPGAGSLIAQNVLLNAEPDGSRFMIMNAIGVAAASLGGAEGAEFSLDEYTYLGRITAQPRVVVVSGDSDYETIEEVIEDWENIDAGSPGPGASDFADLQVLREALDIPFNVITGFDGSEENALALQRGDTDLMTGDIDGRLPNIEAGDERPILVIGAERDDNFPDVPTLLELELDEDAMVLAEAHVNVLELGRPMIAPPGMEEGLTEYLREAFWSVWNDEDFLADAEQQGWPIRPLTGAETQELVERIERDAPEIFREVMAEAN